MKDVPIDRIPWWLTTTRLRHMEQHLPTGRAPVEIMTELQAMRGERVPSWRDVLAVARLFGIPRGRPGSMLEFGDDRRPAAHWAEIKAERAERGRRDPRYAPGFKDCLSCRRRFFAECKIEQFLCDACKGHDRHDRRKKEEAA